MALEEFICSSVSKLWTSLEWSPQLYSKWKAPVPLHIQWTPSITPVLIVKDRALHLGPLALVSLCHEGHFQHLPFSPGQMQTPWEQKLFLFVHVYPYGNSRCSLKCKLNEEINERTMPKTQNKKAQKVAYLKILIFVQKILSLIRGRQICG